MYAQNVGIKNKRLWMIKANGRQKFIGFVMIVILNLIGSISWFNKYNDYDLEKYGLGQRQSRI